jgi:hypothetical protein
MEFFVKYWAYLLPILIIQITFQVIALVDLARRPLEEIRGHSKTLWVVIIIIFEILGPVIYFIFGKKYDAGDKN